MLQENFAKFKDGTWRLAKVVTQNDWQQLVKRKSNKSWVSESEIALLRIDRFGQNNIFTILFRISDAVQIS